MCGEALSKILTDEGVELVMEATVRHVSRNTDGLFTLTASTSQGERRLRGTHLLVATGRTPNTDTLGLDKAGITLNEEGFIEVNEHLETNVRGVYALGDVHGGPQFTHISYDDYRIVRDNLLGRGKRRTTKQRPLPYCVYTEPQLGRIERLLDLEELPDHLLILGGGYIGLDQPDVSALRKPGYHYRVGKPVAGARRRRCVARRLARFLPMKE